MFFVDEQFCPEPESGSFVVSLSLFLLLCDENNDLVVAPNDKQSHTACYICSKKFRERDANCRGTIWYQNVRQRRQPKIKRRFLMQSVLPKVCPKNYAQKSEGFSMVVFIWVLPVLFVCLLLQRSFSSICGVPTRDMHDEIDRYGKF